MDNRQRFDDKDGQARARDRRRNGRPRRENVLAPHFATTHVQHAGLAVAGHEAGELLLTGHGERPDNLALGTRLHVGHVRTGVHHVRRPRHRLSVRLELAGRAQHHLVQHPAGVGHDELHRGMRGRTGRPDDGRRGGRQEDGAMAGDAPRSVRFPLA